MTPSPFRSGIFVFSAKRRKKKKTPCPSFFLKDHALPCMVWPALCPLILQPARAPVLPMLPMVLVVECLVSRCSAQFPPPIRTSPSRFRSYAHRAYTRPAGAKAPADHNRSQARASCAYPHRCPAQRPAGRRKADRQRATESIPAHLGALTRPHRPHSSIAKGTR